VVCGGSPNGDYLSRDIPFGADRQRVRSHAARNYSLSYATRHSSERPIKQVSVAGEMPVALRVRCGQRLLQLRFGKRPDALGADRVSVRQSDAARQSGCEDGVNLDEKVSPDA
jgi:hypothetical protein